MQRGDARHHIEGPRLQRDIEEVPDDVICPPGEYAGELPVAAADVESAPARRWNRAENHRVVMDVVVPSPTHRSILAHRRSGRDGEGIDRVRPDYHRPRRVRRQAAATGVAPSPTSRTRPRFHDPQTTGTVVEGMNSSRGP